MGFEIPIAQENASDFRERLDRFVRVFVVEFFHRIEEGLFEECKDRFVGACLDIVF